PLQRDGGAAVELQQAAVDVIEVCTLQQAGRLWRQNGHTRTLIDAGITGTRLALNVLAQLDGVLRSLAAASSDAHGGLVESILGPLDAAAVVGETLGPQVRPQRA